MDSKERLREAHSKGFRIDGGKAFNSQWEELALNKDKSGYWRFTVRFSDGKYRNVYVHRLLAFQKFGEAMFEPGIQVRHRNNIESDNSWDNIFIGTSSQNNMDKSPETRRRAAGQAARKLTDAQVQTLKDDRAAGATYIELSAKYGIQKSTISYIVRGITCR